MNAITRKVGGLVIIVIFGLLCLQWSPQQASASPDGFITFEEGTDSAPISSTIPGLVFTNTNGYDWVYGDWRTGDYNGKYPNGIYTSNGDFFAWLGPNQGDGRIDFTGGGASYLSVWVSTNVSLTLTAYYSDGEVANTASLPSPNTSTGQMANLIVKAPPGDVFHYAIISGTANYWLIDDLSTDADGVPDERNPVVFVPGLAGSKFENDHNRDGAFDEVWPNSLRLAIPGDDGFLRVLKLQTDGKTPFGSSAEFTTLRVGRQVITSEPFTEVYQPTIDFFTSQTQGYELGVDFITCPYDWRQSLEDIAAGSLTRTLDKCINQALENNPEASQVNILAHSMGGLVSRYYLSDANHAQKVDRLVTMGTPFLGAPKITLGVVDELCFIEPWGICLSNPDTLHEIVQNFPSAYEISPSTGYFQVYPNGFYHRAYDADNNGSDDGYLKEAQIWKILESHNPELTAQAKTVQGLTGGWSNGGSHGVEVYAMVGDTLDTIGTIVEYLDRPWYNPWAQPQVAYRTQPVNGDGTVPVRSADMRDLQHSVDLSGGAFVYYFNLTHGDLPKNMDVLQLAANIFNSSAPAVSQPANAQPAGIADANGIMKDPQAAAPQAVYRTSPLPLNGRFIAIDGPVAVNVVDDQGNHIGLEPGGQFIEVNVPNASHRKLGSSTFLFLPNDRTYTLEIIGRQLAVSDVRIQKYEDDVLTQTDLYDDLPVTGSSHAWLDYHPTDLLAGAFALDQNGDGTLEAQFPITATLDENESADYIAPKTSIAVTGNQLPNGLYSGLVSITLTAEDNPGGTGVVKLEYSLDGGIHVFTYTGPFTVDADTTTMLYAKATDRAGNEEAPLAIKQLGNRRLWQPVVVR